VVIYCCPVITRSVSVILPFSSFSDDDERETRRENNDFSLVFHIVKGVKITLHFYINPFMISLSVSLEVPPLLVARLGRPSDDVLSRLFPRQRQGDTVTSLDICWRTERLVSILLVLLLSRRRKEEQHN
jgi:hypothetical protein